MVAAFWVWRFALATVHAFRRHLAAESAGGSVLLHCRVIWWGVKMQSGNIVVRLVEQRDAVELRQNCFPMTTLEETQPLLAANLQGFSQGTVVMLVAEVDGKVVGTVTLQRNTHRMRRHRAVVGGLVVHRPYEGQGIARRLMEESERTARSLDIQILELTCRGGEPAEQVYRRLGFHEFGRLPRGLLEPAGKHHTYDEVYFYRRINEKIP